MNEDLLLRKAQVIRKQEHRLKPALRLKTLEDVVNFIHDKGLVSMLGGNELPSVVSALTGRPWKPSGKGFTSWLDWWSLKVSGKSAGHMLTEIPRRKDIIGTRIFRKNKTFVSDTLWPILDPIIKHYQDLAKTRKILSQLEWKILQTLEEKGPTRTDRLRTELRLEGKQHTSKFHRAFSQLENHGLIIGYEDPTPERHMHAAIWHLWSQRVNLNVRSVTTYSRALAELLERTLDACIFAREEDVSKWFCWDGELMRTKNELLDQRKILRAGPFLFASRIS